MLVNNKTIKQTTKNKKMENQTTTTSRKLTNTYWAIERTKEALMSEFNLTQEQVDQFEFYLENIANSKKLDVLNQINNLKY